LINKDSISSKKELICSLNTFAFLKNGKKSRFEQSLNTWKL